VPLGGRNIDLPSSPRISLAYYLLHVCSFCSISTADSSNCTNLMEYMPYEKTVVLPEFIWSWRSAFVERWNIEEVKTLKIKEGKFWAWVSLFIFNHFHSRYKCSLVMKMARLDTSGFAFCSVFSFDFLH